MGFYTDFRRDRPRLPGHRKRYQRALGRGKFVPPQLPRQSKPIRWDTGISYGVLTLLPFFPPVCTYCGASERYLTVDHVIPLSKGGTDTRDNKVPACKPCNGEKANILLEDLIAQREMLLIIPECGS